MSKQDLRERFIQLRIKGETFERIAKELFVSKQTLINWSKEDDIKETIATARLMRYQSILEIHKQNREAKIEYFAELTNKLKQELEKRDFSKVPTEKLLKLILDSEDKLNELIPSQEFGGGYVDFTFENNPSFTFNPVE